MAELRKPRVVLVTARFPHPSETFIVRRFEGLLARGWDMHVLCERTPEENWSFFPSLASSSDARRRIHPRAPLSPWRSALLRALLVIIRCLLQAPRRTLEYVVRGWGAVGPRVLRRIYRDAPLILLAPDVVHFAFGTNARGSEHVGRALRCALVTSFQGADLNYAGLESEPGYYTDVWRATDVFHFLSRDLLGRAERRGYSSDERAHVVVPGVDASMFQPQPRMRDDTEPLRILSVGRLHWKKGYEYALQAVRALIDRGIDCRYRIVGAGEHRQALLYETFDLGLQDVVELVGSRPAAGVREEMQWADVMLHAATSEGFCYAVLEAQAMELPVVTSDADGLAENVADGETGFVVLRRDPEAMAEKLFRLAKDVDLRARIGRAARERVRREFTTKREIEGFEAVYQEAISHRRT